MRRYVLVLLLLYTVSVCECRKFTRCRLAAELMKTKTVQKSFLGNWVCLIEQVSNRDTKAFTKTSSGKKFYGLYQIPSQWCREGKKGGECNIACESLLDDDIRDDTVCAVNIFHKEGFKYWPKWTARCKNDIDFITREIYKCPDLRFRSSRPRKRKPARKDVDRQSLSRSSRTSHVMDHIFKVPNNPIPIPV